MKPTSIKLNRILAELSQPELLASARRADPHIFASIAELGRLRDPAAILPLLAYLFSPDRTVSRCAAESIGALYEYVGPELVALDAEIRRIFICIPKREKQGKWIQRFFQDETWKVLSPDDLEILEGLPYEDVLLGLISSHSKGFVRQASLRRLARFSSGAELPFLLLRANDWVDPIAEEASTALRARLTPAFAPHFVRHLDLVARLLGWERRDHRAFVESVYRLIREIDDGAYVLAGLDSPDKRIKRLSYSLAYGLSRPGETELMMRAFQERDAFVQRWALKTSLEKSSPEVIAGLIVFLDRSRSPLLRREALSLRAARLPDGAVSVLRESMFDANGSVRETARFLAARMGDVDALARYRAELEKPSPGFAARIAAAVAGVGETGSAADAGVVRRFAADPSAVVRREVVRAIYRLDPESGAEVFTAALEDSSRAVARVGREILRRKPLLVDAGRLWRIVTESSLSYKRNIALHLMALQERWTALEYLLRAETLADDDLVRQADEALRYWLDQTNKDFSRLSDADAKRLAPLIAASRSPLKGEVESVFRAAR